MADMRVTILENLIFNVIFYIIFGPTIMPVKVSRDFWDNLYYKIIKNVWHASSLIINLKKNLTLNNFFYVYLNLCLLKEFLLRPQVIFNNNNIDDN